MLNSKTCYRLLPHTVITVVLMFLMSPLHAGVYKWTDANGQVHYSQTPPPKSVETSGEAKVMNNLSRKYFPRMQDGDTYCAGEKLYNFTSHDVKNTIFMLIDEKHRTEQLAASESDTERRDILRCKVQFYKTELEQHNNRIAQIRNEYESLEKRRKALSESKRTNCHSESSLLIGDEARSMAGCLDRHDSIYDIENRLRELKRVYFMIREKLDG